MVHLGLDLEASGKATGTQAQQHRIHLAPADEMGGSVWDTLCIQLQQCHSSTAALKNFCFYQLERIFSMEVKLSLTEEQHMMHSRTGNKKLLLSSM